MAEQGDGRYRSRKFIIAVWSMALVTLVTLNVTLVSLITRTPPDSGTIIALSGGYAVVLAAYGAANAAVHIGGRQ